MRLPFCEIAVLAALSYLKGSYVPASITLFYIDCATYVCFNKRTLASMGTYTSGNQSSHT